MKTYKLLGADGMTYESSTKAKYGGVRNRKLYGTLKCPAAMRAIAKGGDLYKKHRVFFADEATAIAAGHRPCGTCLQEKYTDWKNAKSAVTG